MKKIYHDYRKWEDFQNGMFALTDPNCSEKISASVELLSDENRLLSAMLEVSHKWVFAAEVNLSNKNRNRQAWLGQAACCYAHKAPEFITREAWNTLDTNTKEKANGIADMVICKWEKKHNENL